MAFADFSQYEVVAASVKLCLTIKSPEGVESDHRWVVHRDVDLNCIKLSLESYSLLDDEGKPQTSPKGIFKIRHRDGCDCSPVVIADLSKMFEQ